MLTNFIRKHFGIKEVDLNWRRVDAKGFWNSYLLVSEDNVIQKQIYPVDGNDFSYKEVDYSVELNAELKIVGKKGKIQPLTLSSFSKIKPDGKSFEVSNNQLKLVNLTNGIQLFAEYNLNLTSAIDAIRFLNDKISKPSKFFSEELNTFLTRKKQINQKIKQGDIFRVKLANEKFAYGRVIADLKKFMTHDTGIVSEWQVNWRGRTVFNEILISQILVDYFLLITDNPYLKYKDLETFETSPSICITDWHVKHEAYVVVDNTAISPSSFDLPMSVDTYYQYVPICHILKWGACVVAFKPDEQVEQEKDMIVKKDQDYYTGFDNSATEYYIDSCLKGEPNYAFLNNRGDLRYADCEGLRELISTHLHFDISSEGYDSFADRYGFMDRLKILEFTNC